MTPRTVRTVDELEGLPVGTVVRHWYDEIIEYEDGSWERGVVAEKRLDNTGLPAWFVVGRSLGYRSHQADLLPATVLTPALTVTAEQVERIAATVAVEDLLAARKTWGDLAEFQRAPYRVTARAVLAAMGIEVES